MSSHALLKTPMPVQPAVIRRHNFEEVAIGYTENMAVEEAKRCIQCKTRPCMKGCPVNVRIPEFIAQIADGAFEEAYQTVSSTNNLPAICGRVCPQESQCEALCVRGMKGEPVAIGRLERFVADYHMGSRTSEPEENRETAIKVAVVGAGPAGLSCAGDLTGYGYNVTLFEAFHIPGGVLVYGIPEFRLPKSLVRKEIDQLRHKGVKILTNHVVGKTVTLADLKAKGYKAVFIGSGAGLPRFMNIPGENLNGVYSANEFLTRINLMKAYRFPEWDTPVKIGRNVAVIGGGNVAMDAARSAVRLGAENVSIIYRRSRGEMPARLEEIQHAEEEAVKFRFLVNPVRIEGTDDGWVKGLECVEMILGDADSSGRRRPVVKEGSEYRLSMDTIIMAIGQSPNPLIKRSSPQLETQSWGGIVVNEDTGATSLEGVYAGGDAVTGSATVILAMGAGKKAAKAIHEYLK